MKILLCTRVYSCNNDENVYLHPCMHLLYIICPFFVSIIYLEFSSTTEDSTRRSMLNSRSRIQYTYLMCTCTCTCTCHVQSELRTLYMHGHTFKKYTADEVDVENKSSRYCFFKRQIMMCRGNSI